MAREPKQPLECCCQYEDLRVTRLGPAMHTSSQPHQALSAMTVPRTVLSQLLVFKIVCSEEGEDKQCFVYTHRGAVLLGKGT